ncbi:MAG: MCP four helix bundle domain-containing protein, partial [Gammaproteobacteria bacterium]|nr:MCP four helix bundle domain-containing protein [Gammaproteobacteria bacterium]
MLNPKTLLVVLKLNNLSIRNKIWGGFGLILLVLAAVAMTAALSLSKTESSVDNVVNRIQPMVLASNDLTNALNEASGALGYYLLSQDNSFKKDYINGLESITQSLSKLSTLAQGQSTSTETRELLALIETDVKKFAGYKDQMLELTENEMKNKPGLAYSGSEINPLSQQILQLMSQSIMSELEEPVSAKRRALLVDLQDFRYAWANVMNGARAFMAFRNKSSIDEYDLYMEQSGKTLDKIKKVHSSILTFDQADAIEQIVSIRKQFITNFEKTKELHGSDKWRTDIYLVKTELGLIMAKIKRNLSMLIDSQRNLIESESQQLLTFVSGTKVFVYTMLFIGMALGLGLAWAVSF